MGSRPTLPGTFEPLDILDRLLPEGPDGTPADGRALAEAVGAPDPGDDPGTPAPDAPLADSFIFETAPPADHGPGAPLPAAPGAAVAGFDSVLEMVASLTAGHGAARLPEAAGGPELIAPETGLAAAKPGGTPGGGGKPGSDPGGTEAPVLAASYNSGLADTGAQDNYNVTIEFFGEWPAELMHAFGAAADFLSSLITAGLEDALAWHTFEDPAVDGYTLVDDLLIEAYLPAIDGTGEILGRAGPALVRNAGDDPYTPAVGLMEFDVADAQALDTAGNWDAVVLHEMLHVLGIGSLWDYWNVTDTFVIDDMGTKKPNDDIIETIYTGSNGAARYAAEKDAAAPEQLLIESDGGSGTAGAHWDEETYGAELMTGYLGGAAPYLADWTIAALADIGYSVVDLSGSDNALSSGIDLETRELMAAMDIVDASLIA